MKLLVIFLSFVLQICLHEQTQYRCALPLNPNDGVLCLHNVSASFGYNASENKCMLFIYGGCGGNENRFDSVEECEDMCLKKRTDQPSVIVAKQKDARCFLPLNPVGPMCNAFTPRFGYDQKEDRCMLYIYSGCGGNANRFEYIEECEEACLRSKGDILENLNLPFNISSNEPEKLSETEEVVKEDENQMVKEYMPLKAETGLKVEKNKIKTTTEKIITIAQGNFFPENVTESPNLFNSNELEKGEEHEELVKEDKIQITHNNSISSLKPEKGEKINEIKSNLEIIKQVAEDSSDNMKKEQLMKNMHKDKKHRPGTISIAKHTEKPTEKIFKLSKGEIKNKSVNGSNVIKNQKMIIENETKHYKPEKVQVKWKKEPIIKNTKNLSKNNITKLAIVPPKQNTKKNVKNKATTMKKDENQNIKLNTAEQKNIKNVKNEKPNLKKIKLVSPKENITNGDKFHNTETLQANEKKGKTPTNNKQDGNIKILNKNEKEYKKTESYKAVVTKHKSRDVKKYEPSKDKEHREEYVNNHINKSENSGIGNDMKHIVSNNIDNKNKSRNVHKDKKVENHMEQTKTDKKFNHVKNSTNVKITHKKKVKHIKNTKNKGNVKKNETSSNVKKDYISKASDKVNAKKNIKLSHLKKKEKGKGNAKNDEIDKLPKGSIVKKNIKNNTHPKTTYKAKGNKSKISKIHKGHVKKNEVSPIKNKGKDKFLKGRPKKAETAKFHKANVKNNTIVKIPYKTKANKNEKSKIIIHKGGTGNGEKYRSVKINEKLKAPHKENAKHSKPKGVKGNAQIKERAKIHKVSVKNDGILNKVKKHEKSNKTLIESILR